MIFYPFLFAFYPVIFLYALNVKETPLREIFLPLFLSFFLAVFLFFLAKIFFRASQKAALFTFLSLFLFFSYGHFFDFLRQTFLARIILGKHIFFFSFYFFLFLFFSQKIYHAPPKFPRLTSVLNFLSLFLFLFPLFLLSTFFLRKLLVKNKIREISSGEVFLKEKVPPRENLPDIYYFILDRYGREDVLKRVYDFDNRDFLLQLKKMGFYVAEKSQANYADTLHSLASSLNMTHLDFLSVLSPSDDVSLLQQKISQNEVFSLFKSLGYKIFYFGSWWESTRFNPLADKNINLETLSGFHQLLFQSTLLYPLKIKFFDQPDFLKEQWLREEMKWKELKKVAKEKGRPKFVFAHFLTTHAPYVFREDGRFLPEEEQESLSEKEKYRQGLKYTNRRLLEFFPVLFSENPHPIIILQADEGPYPERIGDSHDGFDWNQAKKEEIWEKMAIFNAYFFPKDREKVLYPEITPVNTFRLVFNYYFNQNYPLLPDKSFLTNLRQPYRFLPWQN